MKRILTVSLAALLLILSVQPVAAASGFSLYQGEIALILCGGQHIVYSL